MLPGAPPYKYKTAEFPEDKKLSGSFAISGDYNPLANIVYDDPDNFGGTKKVNDMWDYVTPRYFFNLNFRVHRNFYAGFSIFSIFPLPSGGGTVDFNIRLMNRPPWNIAISPDIGGTGASGFLNANLVITSGEDTYSSSGWNINLPIVFSRRLSTGFIINFGPEISYGEMVVNSTFYSRSDEFLGNPPEEYYYEGRKFTHYLNPGAFLSLGIGKQDSKKFFMLATVTLVEDLYERKRKIVLFPAAGLSF